MEKEKQVKEDRSYSPKKLLMFALKKDKFTFKEVKKEMDIDKALLYKLCRRALFNQEKVKDTIYYSLNERKFI